MTDRPSIGVTTQTLHAIDGIPAALPESWVMNQRYILAATIVGGVPWMIPLLDDDSETLRSLYDRLDGILIPGGVDMDPATFGEDRHPRLGAVDPARDRVELQLTRWAIEDQKPLLGLCRGIQVINVALGGTLYQDIADQVPAAIKHDYFPTAGYDRTHLAHEVAVAQGTRLRAVMERPRLHVNSMHHQGIKTLASELIPAATAPDGLIEAVEVGSEHFMVGVQWHPEVFEMTDPHTRHLFREFIEAARGWRRRR
ncbi:MAG TPA: gamma-glutamyl-gamma-aminobutyrate hydrolase family protein [Gemmatimonadales bacterium]|jgi:putative glutamine amidotransferase|nr:gamma-glutamyl-gamma-aminobutyrate hydrolase family protein [Gemmatimonadales bacterium]